MKSASLQYRLQLFENFYHSDPWTEVKKDLLSNVPNSSLKNRRNHVSRNPAVNGIADWNLPERVWSMKCAAAFYFERQNAQFFKWKEQAEKPWIFIIIEIPHCVIFGRVVQQ